MAADEETRRKAQEFLDSLPPLEEVATSDLQRALDRAKQDARQRGDQGVTLEHLLHAIIAEPVGAEILRGAGADVEALDRDLVEFMDLATASGANSTGPIAACERVKKLAVLHSKGTRGTSVSLGGVLAFSFLAPSQQAMTLLKQQGITRLDVLRFISHRISKGGSRAPLPSARLVRGDLGLRSRGIGRYDVVLHNDDFTTREFVVQILTSLFDMSTEDAAAVAMAAHEHGRGVIGRYEHKSAEKKIEKALRRAEKAGFPLLLSIEPTADAGN